MEGWLKIKNFVYIKERKKRLIKIDKLVKVRKELNKEINLLTKELKILDNAIL